MYLDVLLFIIWFACLSTMDGFRPLLSNFQTFILPNFQNCRRLTAEQKLANFRRNRLPGGKLNSGAAPVANTKYGSLTGVGGGNATVNQFLGVPFATPPVGNLRWKAPLAPQPWGSRDATWFNNSCMQSQSEVWTLFTDTSEDCLYLNVYVPNKTPPPNGFPIMLFW
jgi:hypothetical protein